MTAFPPSGPPLLWKRPLGQGFSGAIVVGGRVFTQFQERGGQYLVCLDAETGSTVWQTRYDWPWQYDAKWPGPYATPTWSEGLVFFAGGQGLVGAADGSDGHILWKRNLLLEFKGKGMHFGYACTPLVEHGKVFFNVGSTNPAFVALSTKDGKTAWATGSDNASYSSPILVTCGGETQVLAFLEIAAFGCSPHTGEQRWYSTWGGGYMAHGAWPLWREPYVFRTLPFRRGCRLDRVTREGGAFAVEEVWTSRELSCDFMTPAIVGNHIYGFDVTSVQAARQGRTPGDFVCLDFATGAVCWRTNATGHASVIASGDKLLIFNEFGTLILAAADPTEYRELARATLTTDGICWTAPTLHRDRLIIRNHESIACYYLGADPAGIGQTAIHTKAERPRLARHWLDAYETKDLWAPTLSDLALWFVFGAAGVYGLVWIVHLPLRKRHGAIHFDLAFAVFVALVALRPVSAAMGRFIFTWPVAVHALFLWVLMAGSYAQERRSRRNDALARAALALFALACFGYVTACSRLMIIAGWGFLTGLIAATPVMFRVARRLIRAPPDAATFGLIVLSFAIHFWASAIVVLWRANAGGEIAEF